MTCANCSSIYSASARERTFHERLRVPTPRLCSDCRLQRRMAFRNERNFYNRRCDLCQTTIISQYDTEVPFPVYCSNCWWSDRWDAREYAQNVDFSRPFFDQMMEVQNRVPHEAVITVHNTNSPYTNWVDESANCYMVFGSSRCEDTYYSEMCVDLKNCMDCTNVTRSEQCYFCVDVSDSYAVQYCKNVHSSRDVAFSFDLVGCHDCLFSYNQRHQEYLIFNQRHTPEQFAKKRTEIFASYESLEQARETFLELMRQDAIHKYANLTKSEAVEGDNLYSSTRSYNSFDSSHIEDCVNVVYGDHVKDCVDVFGAVRGSEELYEVFSATGSRTSWFSIATWNNHNVHYSFNCQTSSDLFGCAGMKKAQFAILNKTYSESEYHNLVRTITEHMRKTPYSADAGGVDETSSGEFGEFFSVRMSPFAYNETTAFDNYPMTREAVEARGWRWKKPGQPAKTDEPAKTTEQVQPSQSTKDQFVFTCATCQKPYKLIAQEIEFYERHLLPHPTACHDCRYRQRLELRNPRKLWERQCTCAQAQHDHHLNSQCPRKFKTSYAPERPETVYGEKCYQLEVM